MEKLTTLDNISNDTLDLIKDKYGDKKGFRVIDDRKERDYFLFAKSFDLSSENYEEYSFIWIGNNLWQYSYINTGCKKKGLWENPLDKLNKILN